MHDGNILLGSNLLLLTSAISLNASFVNFISLGQAGSWRNVHPLLWHFGGPWYCTLNLFPVSPCLFRGERERKSKSLVSVYHLWGPSAPLWPVWSFLSVADISWQPFLPLQESSDLGAPRCAGVMDSLSIGSRKELGFGNLIIVAPDKNLWLSASLFSSNCFEPPDPTGSVLSKWSTISWQDFNENINKSCHGILWYL